MNEPPPPGSAPAFPTEGVLVDASTSYELGNELRRQGDPVSAEAALRETLRLAPDHFEARTSLAFLYLELDRKDEAARLYRDWLASGPKDGARLVKVALFLEGIQEGGLALACLERATELAPGLGAAWFHRGRLHFQSDRIDSGTAYFEQALQNDPDLGTAFLQLSHARHFRSRRDPLIDFFMAQATDPKRPESTRACFEFALGKIWDDLEEWDQALQWVETANAIRRKTIRFDPDRCRSLLRERLVAPHRVWAPSTLLPREEVEPLFIVGLPRSGCTFIEQVLLEHPAIRSAGELPMLPALVQETHLVERWREADQAGAPPSDDELEALRASYREVLMRSIPPPTSGESTRYVIDKNPLNFFHVGVIRRLFPHAPILALERDLRDVLISLYFHDFTHPDLAFTYSIDHLLFFFRCHETLMPLWKAITAGHLRAIRYETLVAEPATVVQAVLRFLALPATGEAGTRLSAPNIIARAHAWQARQPIYGRAPRHWEHYAPGLLRLYPELRSIGFGP